MIHIDVDDLAACFSGLAVVKYEASETQDYASSQYYDDGSSSGYSSSSCQTVNSSPPRCSTASKQRYTDVSPLRYPDHTRQGDAQKSVVRPSTAYYSDPVDPPCSVSTYQGNADNCNNCLEPTTPKVVLSSNPNGNAGRPYSICENTECPKTQRSSTGKSSFVRWNDNIGINAANPKCNGCDEPSRLNTIGKKSTGKQGNGFWNCGNGACNYYSEDIVGYTKQEVGKEGTIRFKPV